jgi:hypothetical protein
VELVPVETPEFEAPPPPLVALPLVLLALPLVLLALPLVLLALPLVVGVAVVLVAVLGVLPDDVVFAVAVFAAAVALGVSWSKGLFGSDPQPQSVATESARLPALCPSRCCII